MLNLLCDKGPCRRHLGATSTNTQTQTHVQQHGRTCTGRHLKMLRNITMSHYYRVKVTTGIVGCQFTNSAALLPWEQEIPICV